MATPRDDLREYVEQQGLDVALKKAMATVLTELPSDGKAKLVELLQGSRCATAVVDDRWQVDDSVHLAALTFELQSADGAIRIRQMEERDLDAACDICVSSFNEFNESVGLAPEFPPRSVVDVSKFYYSRGTVKEDDSAKESGFVSFVAVDQSDAVVGANLLEYQDGVGGIGPICSRAEGAGKLLMMAVMKAAAQRDVRSVRLLQIVPNTRSFSLYLRLGFEPRRVNMEYVLGSACTAQAPEGITVSPIGEEDVAQLSALHEKVCGSPRARDIASAVGSPHPNCVARNGAGELVGYTTGSYLGGHTVALSEEALQALVISQSVAIARAQAAGAPIPPTTIFVAQQYSHFARWLAKSGFRLTRQLTSMSYGPHPEPAGGYYLPSIAY